MGKADWWISFTCSFSFNLSPFGYQKCFHFSLLFKQSVFTFCQLFCSFTYIMFLGHSRQENAKKKKRMPVNGVGVPYWRKYVVPCVLLKVIRQICSVICAFL